MIVIDGPDHVGKTTLAMAVTNELNRRGYPHIPQKFSKLPHSFHHINSYRPFIHPHVVMDRFYPSRACYGEVIDNQRTFTPFEYRLVESWFVQAGGVMVFVTAEDAYLKKHFGEKDEMYGLEQVRKVNDAYVELAEQRHVMVDFEWRVGVKRNYPADDLGLVDKIASLWEQRAETLRSLN